MAHDPETSVRLREQRRFILIAQVPLLAVIAAMTCVLLLENPELLGMPGYVIGGSLGVAASIVAFVASARHHAGRWIALVPLADMVVIALLREAIDAKVGTLPALGVLLLLPVLWLTIELGVWALPIVFVGALLVIGLPFLDSQQTPRSSMDWLNIALVPLALVLVALGVGMIVARMREDRQRANDLAIALRGTLAEVADRETTMSSITETVDAAILMLDTEGSVIFTNQKARSLHKRATVNADGSAPVQRSIFTEDRVTRVPDEHSIEKRALRGDNLIGRVFWVGETGNQLALTAASNRVVRGDGVTLGTVVVTHDVTRLMEAIQVRDEFLASVSHELRTPLTNILGYLELLEGDSNVAEVAVVRKNAERLNTLIGDLLGNTSARGPRLPANVAAISEDAVATIRPLALAAGISVRHDGLGVAVAEVDVAGIRRVLTILLTNAVRYSAPGDSIVAAITETDDDVVITVTDTGMGIDDADLPRVFDKFFRAPRSRTSAIPGTGLGLSIARAIVEANNGTIEATSRSGVGSVFTVHLPLRNIDEL